MKNIGGTKMQYDIGLGFMGLMLKENDQLHNLPDSGNWLDSNNSHFFFGSIVSFFGPVMAYLHLSNSLKPML